MLIVGCVDSGICGECDMWIVGCVYSGICG